MVFSSALFLYFFLPSALAVYYASGRYKNLALTALSYLFYGWANPAFTLLMAFSTVVDFFAGLVMTGSKVGGSPISLTPETTRDTRQRWALAASIHTNLGLLAFFKYYNFGVDSYQVLASATGLPGVDAMAAIQVVLPLGISFYTFQSMSYSIDVYRGRAAPLTHFGTFACFVSMFPQLVAGPIIRFSDLEAQLRSRVHSVEKFARGCAFFSLGLGKKVLLANPCAEVADRAFDAYQIGAAEAWWGLLAYSLQIYFDFSGYSDMAIGLGLMLGFAFPKNFDAPYLSASITEFWRRWHISLSTWLRDYLYLPLGGNRKGARRTYVNLATVMLFGGLWHGASWNFVLWGAMHGSLLAFERWNGKRPLYGGAPASIQVALTFLLVALTWVPFRAATLKGTGSYYAALFGQTNASPAGMVATLNLTPGLVLAVLVASLIAFAWREQTWTYTRQLKPIRVLLIAAVLLISMTVLSAQSYNPFIYFIF